MPTADTAKEALRSAWDSAAEGWDAKTPQIRAWLEEATARMIERSGAEPGARVLDLAAGAGDQTLDLARTVGPAGSVLAVDISEAILQLALRNARRAGFRNVATLTADAEALVLEAGSFDAAVCRLGLMFCTDASTALHNVRACLRIGGRFSALVFSGPEHNPCFAQAMATARRHAGLPPGDPFLPGSLLSLGRPGLLDRWFREAGFEAVSVEALEAPFRLPSARDYVDFLRSSAPPFRQLIAHLQPPEQAGVLAEVEARMASFQTPEGWVGPNQLLLATGIR